MSEGAYRDPGIPARIQWEYKSVEWSNKGRLANLGLDGWECISVIYNGLDYYAFLKRALP